MIHRIIGIIVCFLIVLSLSGPPTDAEIYQWRDENGFMHFSDSPPPDGSAADISGRGAPPSPSAYQSESSGSSNAGEQSLTPAGGMFWKISGEGMKTSYLLGTIHSEDPRVLAFRTAIVQGFNAADTFIMEVDMDSSAVMAIGSAMLITEGEDLEALLGADDFKKAASAMVDYGIPASILKRMKPWVVMSMLSMPKPKTGEFMDLVLQKRAGSQGKSVHGLESAEEQLAVFEGLSMNDQVSLLKATIRQMDDFPKIFELLIQAYLSDDLNRIATIANSYNEGVEADLVQRFMFRLNEERNYRMADRMMPHLKSGNAFVAVGALHLAGDKGLISLLRQNGFTVTSIE